MDPLSTLIQLYCKHTSAAIDAAGGVLLLTAFKVDSREALLGIPGYKEAYTLVRDCAAIVDRLTEQHEDQMRQVREGLRLLRRMIDDEAPENRINTVRQLIECRLYQHVWGDAERAEYDKKKELLEWKDFFLSYTNRDLATNEQFKQLVKSCFSAYPPTAEACNYLALVIAHHLQGYQHLSGFFDRDKLKVGENIQDKVDAFCHRTFAFVQLVEPLTFDKEPPKNWCFHEYQQFSQYSRISTTVGNRNRHCFILIHEKLNQILPVSPPPAYAEWSGRMDTTLTLSIFGYKKNDMLMAQLKKVAEQIVKIRAELIDAWLLIGS